MTINLPPDLDQAVRKHITSGDFHTAEDVLRAALDQFDVIDLRSLRQSIADEEAGRLKPLDEVVSSIRQKHDFRDFR